MFQLVYKHALGEHPAMEEAIGLMFEAMSEFRLGKSSTLFHKMAQELGNIVLTNKKAQTTRFVRSFARAAKTFLQNLPTIVMVLSTTYDELALAGKNTAAKQIQAKLVKLRDPRFLLKLVGLAQIMEAYCEVSLEGQYSYHLPTQVWDSVHNNKEKLELLGQAWEWHDKDLKYTDCEAPKKIVERLVETAVYRPKVHYRNVVRRVGDLREARLLEGPAKVLHLFEEKEMVKPLAGEIPMEVPRRRRRRRQFMSDDEGEGEGEEMEEQQDGRKLTEEDTREVEELLSSLCRAIVKEWQARMVQSPLDQAACEVLGKAMEEEDQDLRMVMARDRLASLLSKVPLVVSERYEVVDLLDGYTTYMDIFSRLEPDHKAHFIYEQWYRKFISVDNPGESCLKFAELFEAIQVC